MLTDTKALRGVGRVAEAAGEVQKKNLKKTKTFPNLVPSGGGGVGQKGQKLS